MDEHTYRVLEYGKILEILASYAATEPGRDAARGLYPSTDALWITKRLDETSEMVRAINEDRPIDLSNIRDIRRSVHHASLGGDPLSPAELLDVARTLEAIQKTKTQLLCLGKDFPNLVKLGDLLETFPALFKRIYLSINDDAEVRDDASEELLRLRRKIKTVKNQIRKELNLLLSDSNVTQYLQENTVSMRQNRYVLFVKAEWRTKIPGIMLDKSASGSTLFIEPACVSDLDNELAGHLVDEKNEILRILRDLCAYVGASAKGIQKSLHAISWIDLAYAKARLSKDYGMNPPLISPNLALKLYSARHPLLIKIIRDAKQKTPAENFVQDESCLFPQDALPPRKTVSQAPPPPPQDTPDDVIPNDIRLGEDFDLLVITGPNTGGKTVVLKTVGLLCLMAQSGMHIPAAYGSELPIFGSVYVDIGDEQSLEQSLSTFSSHISQIVRVLQRSSKNSLVLLDELGAGTDPAEGAALGLSVLNEILNINARAIVTTHLGALKGLAYRQKRVENSCVEFDLESLRPTYRLSIGQPGLSNAIHIARRLGMPRHIVKDALSHLDNKKDVFSDMIAGIQESKTAAEQNRQRSDEALQKARHAEEQSQVRLRELDVKSERLESEFESELKRIMDRVKDDLMQKLPELSHSSLTLDQKTALVDEIVQKEMSQTSYGARREKFLKRLKVGHYAYVVNLRQTGPVIRLDRKRDLVCVRVGGAVIETRLSHITWPPEEAPEV